LGSWVDVMHADLLGWRDVFIAHWVFSREIPDEVSEGLMRVLTVCYESEVPDDKLREDAGALSEFLETAKRRKAALLENAACTIKQNPRDNSKDNLRGGIHLAIASGLRTQVAASDEIPYDAIAGFLPAYFEYHTDLIARAISNDEFNFFSRKHLNDHFDAEQLVFLADPSLHFFTADQGYLCAARVEPRVHILEARLVEDSAIAPNLMTAEIRQAQATTAAIKSRS
jgi:hypothetical protein